MLRLKVQDIMFIKDIEIRDSSIMMTPIYIYMCIRS